MKVDFSKISSQWHPKNIVSPEQCVHRTLCWWFCKTNPNHVWECPLVQMFKSHMSKHAGCPFCAGKQVCEDNCLSKTHPEVSLQWHPSLNGELRPTSVTAQSNKAAWWRCKRNSSHVWEARIYTRTKSQPAGCPFCAGKQACEDNCLSKTHPEVSLQWHPSLNGELRPTSVTAGSHCKIWWLCPVSEDHVWCKTPNARTQQNGRNCPYCAGYAVCNSNCLSTTHPSLASEWHDKNILTPNDVTFGSRKKVWWNCHGCSHQWLAAIKDRTSGTGCMICRPKSDGEDLIESILQSEGVTYKREYKFSGCRNQRSLPFDFAILEKESVVGLVEFNGPHHYRAVEKWGGERQFEKVKVNDNIKKKYCEDKKLPLLVIPYWEKMSIKNLLLAFICLLKVK